MIINNCMVMIDLFLTLFSYTPAITFIAQDSNMLYRLKRHVFNTVAGNVKSAKMHRLHILSIFRVFTS